MLRTPTPFSAAPAPAILRSPAPGATRSHTPGSGRPARRDRDSKQSVGLNPIGSKFGRLAAWVTAVILSWTAEVEASLQEGTKAWRLTDSGSFPAHRIRN